MTKYLDIIYNRYFDLELKSVTIGGIQTYISHLSALAERLGFKVRILQCANVDGTRMLSPNVELRGFKLPFESRKLPDLLYDKVETSRNGDDEYISLFATDIIIPSRRIQNSIAIQHGIFWDTEGDFRKSFLRSFLSKTILGFGIVKRLRNVDTVVCVDNNFICWHRTQLYERDVKMLPIMNFAPIGDKERKNTNGDVVNVVFARRFFTYRGTRLFGNVMERILSEKDNVRVTFAGTGPDEEWLKCKFENNPNVSFTQYSSEDSLEFHSKFDIAVVPTTGSEGTSLSLLEAMSAHCAVVCTNVGGMTNIVIDGYNGLMVIPEEKELYRAIKRVIEDGQLRHTLANRGYETVVNSFSVSIWESKWTELLKSL